MRTHSLPYPRTGMAATLALSVLLLGGSGASMAATGWIDCSQLPDQTIAGTVHANVLVGANDTICSVTGTIVGNVLVTNDDAACATRPPFTALDLLGGTVHGNVRAQGSACVMVWLEDGATIDGNVTFAADGNLGFLAEERGSTITGNVMLQGGLLWATGAAADNLISRNLICAGGEPLGGLASGTASDWDGTDADIDGSVGLRVIGC